jgi:N-alpha-acetyl-L-2,4-diaminobutyrate deacetylase
MGALMERRMIELEPDYRTKSVAHVSFPVSTDRSGWGSLRLPVGVIRGGDGPTVLLTGASHGDEYEGPIALLDLIRDIQPDSIVGRIFVVPALNLPAFRAGRRLSPVDGLNMNRVFPGNHQGSITERIAAFVYQELVSRADAVLDIHSGGSSLEFVPFCVSHRLPDAQHQQRAIEAMRAFGAPYSLLLEEMEPNGLLDTVVERAGKLFLSTELGGGGSATPTSVAIARRGIENLLVHLGMLDQQLPSSESSVLTSDHQSFVMASRSGLLDYSVELGAEVKTGQVIARILNVDDPLSAPVVERSNRDGLLLGRRHGGLVEDGDFLGLVAFPETQLI